MQPNKSIKIFLNYFLGPVLFVWLSLSIYKQIKNQPQLEASWHHIKLSFQSLRAFNFIAVILLMFANWGLEAWKWKLAVSNIYPIKFLSAYKAILSGVSFSVSTPNRMGEYVGRVLYLPEGNRLKTIPLTVVTSLSQLLVTIIAGTIGLLVLKDTLLHFHFISTIGYHFLITALIGGLVILALLYLRIAVIVKLLERWFKNSPHLYLVQALEQLDGKLLLKLLGISFFRYGVFVLQYFILFQFFNVPVSVMVTGCIISVVFLALAIIPTITLVEVGLRSEISLQLMGIFTTNKLGIGLTSVSIWLINLILPAVMGSILILG